MKNKIMYQLNDITSFVKLNSSLEELTIVKNNLATIKDRFITAVNILYPSTNNPSNNPSKKCIDKQRGFKIIKRSKTRKPCLGNP